MADKVKWTRREFTTRGADPTVVVDWRAETVTGERLFTLREFQGIVVVTERNDLPLGDRTTFPEVLANELHKALEAAHEVELESADIDLDVAAAERAAGWDPNP